MGQTLAVTSTSVSTSINTGALTVVGGVGIGQNLNIGGTLGVTGNANIAGNLGVTGNLNVNTNINGIYQLCDSNKSSMFITNNIQSKIVSGSALYNIGFGYNVLNKDMTGVANIGLGYSVLPIVTSGNTNCAIGNTVLTNNTTGFNNVAIGGGSLATNNTGTNNVAIGVGALLAGNNSNNVGIGYKAGFTLTGGNDNTFIGSLTGMSGTYSGSNNTCIGYDSNPSAVLTSNEITLGNTSVSLTRTWGSIQTYNTTNSTSTTTGALVVSGGAGINSNVNIGGTLGVTGNANIVGNLGVTGNANIAGNLGVTGDLGVTGNVTIGGLINGLPAIATYINVNLQEIPVNTNTLISWDYNSTVFTNKNIVNLGLTGTVDGGGTKFMCTLSGGGYYNFSCYVTYKCNEGTSGGILATWISYNDNTGSELSNRLQQTSIYKPGNVSTGHIYAQNCCSNIFLNNTDTIRIYAWQNINISSSQNTITINDNTSKLTITRFY